MNPPQGNHFASKNGPGSGDPGDTLRLIANLPPPEGLEERVKSKLRVKADADQVLPWPTDLMGGRNWSNNLWARGAAAAAIVFVVAGGSWGVYSRVQPASAPKAIALPHVQTSGGFSTAGAMRTPQTLNGPQVKRPATSATKKPQAASSGSKPAVRQQARHSRGIPPGLKPR